MSEVVKTGAVLGVAAALTVLAFSMKPGEVRLDLFDDQGEIFFPEFTSGDDIAELELTAFRPSSSSIYAFSVKRDDKGVWVIPSHGNYAADADDQMGKAASMMIGLTKQAVVGDAKGRHAEYGVIDPLAEGVETEGRGKRIKLKDTAGNVLADLIVGDEIEGKTGTYYCRLPDKKRVYKTTLTGALSTQFADWIETDLLKAQAFNIQKVTFDNYKIDEKQRQNVIVPGEKIVIAKGADNKFALEGLEAAKEDTNLEKATEISNTLGEIKIVGVRAKPPGLTARLERANGIEAQILGQHLSQKGYFLGPGGKMYSNEGDLLFETKSGVRYTLRFGELVPGEGDAVSAGLGTDKPVGDDDAKQNANNRYLMVSAEFAPELIEKPAAVRLSSEELANRKTARAAIQSLDQAVKTYKVTKEGALPATLAELAAKPEEGEPFIKEVSKDPWGNDYELLSADDSYVILSHAADGAIGGDGANLDVRSDQLPLEDELVKAAAEWSTYDGKVTTGEEEAESLTKRFGPWYYVIDKTLFDKLKPTREDLVTPKAADAAGAADASDTKPGK